ncbi:MAG TPA: hypothetical protein VGP45_03370 [Marinobacter sp.]|nr:hypothetical protein [Marinobacter sp.]
MKRLFVIFVLAALLATFLSLAAEPVPVEQKLIRMHASDVLGEFPGIEHESVDLQAVLADMADDPLLVLKAKAAVLKYPVMARQILLIYGGEPEFQEILRQHGESVLPPIQYFLSNPVGSIEWINRAGTQYQLIKKWLSDNNSGSTIADPAQPLTPTERGWYAVQYIHAEGHDFLGQFLVNPEGKVEWLVSERVLEGLNQFFAGGLRQLEKRHRMNEPIGADDVGWAALDVVVFASAVKVLRLGRFAASTTQNVSRGTRSAALAVRFSRGSRLVLSSARYAKWPLILGTGYLAITHPSLINDLLVELADVMGAPALLIQFVGWLVLLIPALYLLRGLLWLTTPLLQAVIWSVGRLLTQLSGRRAA